METKVINSKKPLPRCKIKSGNTTIVCKCDSIFGDYCAYQYDPSDVDSIVNLVDCLTQIVQENA